MLNKEQFLKQFVINVFQASGATFNYEIIIDRSEKVFHMILARSETKSGKVEFMQECILKELLGNGWSKDNNLVIEVIDTVEKAYDMIMGKSSQQVLLSGTPVCQDTVEPVMKNGTPTYVIKS